MAMTTRCPQCGTAFKVVADQLRIRNGFVRCGVCATVFDGTARLVPPASTGTDTPATPSAPSARPRPATSIAPSTQTWPPAAPDRAPPPVAPYVPPPVAGGHAARVPLGPTPAPSVLRDRAHWARSTGHSEADTDDFDEDLPPPPPPSRAARGSADDRAPALSAGYFDDDRQERRPADPAGDRYGRHVGDEVDWRVSEPPATHPFHDDFHIGEPHRADNGEPAFDDQDERDDDYEPVRGESRTRHVDAIGSGRAPPEFLDEDRHARRRAWGLLWGLACLVALFGLAAQWVYIYRNDIATDVPLLRPLLQSACVTLKCEVGYTRHIERISVESSSLQPQNTGSPREAGKTRLLFKAVLRNRYGMPQPMPSLILELTDFSGSVVIRKILPPAAYLPAARASQPFAPGEQIALAVPLDVADVAVTGYQIDKFFP